jgi:HEPN domain-containing protein
LSPDEAVLEVVRGWMAKAGSDLENATLVLRAGPEGPLDTVSFHAQQCAEKCLKALLCFRGEEVPRTHDVEFLLARTGIESRVEVTVEESRLLTDYATVTRSPGDYEPVSHDEAARAVELAVRIRAAVRKALPEGLLE